MNGDLVIGVVNRHQVANDTASLGESVPHTPRGDRRRGTSLPRSIDISLGSSPSPRGDEDPNNNRTQAPNGGQGCRENGLSGDRKRHRDDDDDDDMEGRDGTGPSINRRGGGLADRSHIGSSRVQGGNSNDNGGSGHTGCPSDKRKRCNFKDDDDDSFPEWDGVSNGPDYIQHFGLGNLFTHFTGGNGNDTGYAIDDDSGTEDPILTRVGTNFNNRVGDKQKQGYMPDILVTKHQNQTFGDEYNHLFPRTTCRQRYEGFLLYSTPLQQNGLHVKFPCSDIRDPKVAAQMVLHVHGLIADPNKSLYHVMSAAAHKQPLNARRGPEMARACSMVVLVSAIAIWNFASDGVPFSKSNCKMWSWDKEFGGKYAVNFSLAQQMSVGFSQHLNPEPDDDWMSPNSILSLDVKKKLGNIVRRVIRHGVVGVDRLTNEEDENHGYYQDALPLPYFLALDSLLPDSALRRHLSWDKVRASEEDKERIKQNKGIAHFNYNKQYY